jgi:hypothetical protein
MNIKKIYGPWSELPAAAQKNLRPKQQGAEENQLRNRELARSDQNQAFTCGQAPPENQAESRAHTRGALGVHLARPAAPEN